ncbi:MAG: MBL fold metallo-hydrolase [Pseudomonadota bacterium]
MTVNLTFRGGAGTVTGSCYLVEHDRGRFMIDCGMFQGNRTTRELNYQPFPFKPSEVDYLLLTHAHIDHSGLVPKLYKHGFRGPIHATAPTLDLLTFMLPDSGRIQESEVERLNRRKRRRGHPEVTPIYNKEDAEACLEHVADHGLEEWFEPGPGVKARFWNAGHILGSVSIELAIDDGGERPLRLLFSGDLGPDEKVFHLAPDAPEGFDYILCESTYGDRPRKDATVAERRAELEDEIRSALDRGGNLVIPCFAVERSQELLHDIGVLMAQGRLPNRPVFLDSPLAGRVTGAFMRHVDTLEDVALEPHELFRDPNFKITESVEESIAINKIDGGAIIISASGMCDAGRIKHHLRNNLWKKQSTVLFVGYQAPGTLGHLISNGKDRVRIHGREVEVRARIRKIGNYSAHADQQELISWVQERLPVRAGIFLTHGEDEPREVMAGLLAEGGIDRNMIHAPQLDDVFELKAGSTPLRQKSKSRVEPKTMTHDWADDYVSFTLKLSKVLDGELNDEERAALMDRLNKAMAE